MAQAPEPTIPLYTLEGVRDVDVDTHYVTTGDGLGLSCLRWRRGAPGDDVVVVLHGLTTSTDMFIMPEQKNLVSFLLDHGYSDVWTFDWRASMRHNYDLFPSTWTLDDIALYDHPAAFEHIRKVVGPGKRIHVICHCVGSITFMMSMFSGLVTDVTSVVSNSVSLTPKVPTWSRFKIDMAPFFVSWLLRFPNLNPRWADLPGPGIPQGKPLAKMVDLVHNECDVSACHMISFMWGTGKPACYQHENLHEVTHRRIGNLFGAISMNYYRHLRKMIHHGRAVKMYPDDPRYDRLPDDYLSGAADVTTPILFITGDHNKVFEDSNVITYDTLKDLQGEERNELRMLPGYGHQDPFMGKDNHEDVFPHLVEFIDRHRGTTPRETFSKGA